MATTNHGVSKHFIYLNILNNSEKQIFVYIAGKICYFKPRFLKMYLFRCIKIELFLKPKK